MMRRILFFTVIIHSSLSAWWWSSDLPQEEESSFECPHRCGQMGSPSLLAIEWEFVQCLYDADVLHDYIEQNLYSSHFRRYHIPEDVQFIFDRPQNIHSPWFQKIVSEEMILHNLGSFSYDLDEMIADDEGNNGTKAAFWTLQPISEKNGSHIGKHFIREFYCNYVCEDVADDEGDCFPECGWGKLTQKCKYQFDNYIDFHNACNALEEDLLIELKDDEGARKYDKSPQLQKNIEGHITSISEKINQARQNYRNIFQSCAQEHDSPSADYQLALHDLSDERYMEAIDHLQALLKKSKIENVEPHLASTLYQSKGEVECDVALYDAAILSLGKAIEKNPANTEAHVQIAIAYFEQGNIQKALDHFHVVSQEKTGEKVLHYSSLSAGLIKGISQGCLQSAEDFVPSMLCSINGLSHGLWALVTKPEQTSKQLLNACESATYFLQQHTPLEVAATLVPELQKLILEQKTLSSFEKGELVGSVIGRYGIDMLFCAGISKGVKAYRDLKQANAMFTFEAILSSTEKNETIINFSKKWRKKTAEQCTKLSQAERFPDVALYRQFRNQHLSELQVRKILHQAGYQTFPRPKGIPQTWKVEISERKGGMVYSPHNNPHIEIRVMPGDPSSTWPSQHKPYVVHKTPAGSLDKKGNVVIKDCPEAHIPFDEYNFNKLIEVIPL